MVQDVKNFERLAEKPASHCNFRVRVTNFFHYQLISTIGSELSFSFVALGRHIASSRDYHRDHQESPLSSSTGRHMSAQQNRPNFTGKNEMLSSGHRSFSSLRSGQILCVSCLPLYFLDFLRDLMGDTRCHLHCHDGRGRADDRPSAGKVFLKCPWMLVYY